MEVEAMAKLQREKRNAPTASTTQSQPCVGASGVITSRPEKDLIVFPESDTKNEAEKNTFADIDLEKLTPKELENLLLDNNFGKSKNNRPLSLMSPFTGGQAFNPSPFSWSTAHTTLNSTLNATVHPQAPVFPSTTFTKPPCSFQNGFTPVMPPFIHHPAQQSPFLSFTQMQSATPLVFQQSVVSPEMAKLFDKIASTSEYLKNGRSSSTDTDTGIIRSLEPVLQLADPPSMECFDWLDLDPLNKCLEKVKEMSGSTDGGETVKSVPEGDPWDAVLRDETEVTEGSSSSGSSKCTMTSNASYELTVSKSHSSICSAAFTEHSHNKKVRTINT